MKNYVNSIYEITKGVINQLASSLGIDFQEQTERKNINSSGHMITPDAYDTRLNGNGRRNQVSARSPK